MAPFLAPENAKAFEEMLAMSENIFRLCLGFAGNIQEAEELTQEVYLKAYRKIDSLENITAAREWLFQIARHVCLDHHRKRPPVSLLPLGSAGDPPDPKTPDSQIIQDEQLGLLKKAIGGLPKKWKETFVLREYGHLSYEEIAAALGIKRGTVMSRLNRARQAIIRKMKEAAQE